MATLSWRGCEVCGASDERALCEVQLSGGQRATLCGTHALMHLRLGRSAGSAAQLRSLIAERRRTERREEYDVLSAAFGGDRRAQERRRA